MISVKPAIPFVDDEPDDPALCKHRDGLPAILRREICL
jgi:hypothetical protein